jgi:DeoR/GlpR family transcriptional regulator of sugar metabolism
MGKAVDVKERQTSIANFILTNGFVTVDELMEKFAISRKTLHRDLDDLERPQLIQKVRNRASAQPAKIIESDFAYRERVNPREGRNLQAGRHLSA